MTIISIGDLVTDYYYKDNKLLGVNGGMSSHNIILNLAVMKNKTKVIGCCGDDLAGKIAIKSLEDFNVDTSFVKIIPNIETRCFHISYFNLDGKIEFTSKKRCPFCMKKKWYENSYVDADETLKNISNDDMLVFDNLNKINQEIVDSTSNIKFLDLGQYFEFENISNEEIVSKLDNKFTIINLNKRVADYFMKRFNFKDFSNLYDITHTKLLTITNGKKGANFIYNGECYKYKLTSIEEEIDSTGAGDAFFASIINSYVKNNLTFNREKFENWYNDSVKITSKVVKKMGARGHIKNLYKIKKTDGYCTCNNFSLQVRKPIKRCNININNFGIRVINALESNALNTLNNIKFLENENYLFIGTGGSYAPAKFAEIVTNFYTGCNSYALLPRNILNRNNKNVNKVFMFSYSGTTSDLIYAGKQFDDSKKYIITKGEIKKIISKTNIPKENIISYRTTNNRGREKGFLSFEGSVVPACLFLKRFVKNLDVEQLVLSQIEYWKEYFLSQFATEKVKIMFLNNTMLNIFTGDFSICAGIDLESKIIESGIYDCIIHEKKNFSHGRFINYENRGNNNTIYFKQKKTDNYEKELLNYLKEDNLLLLESKYDGIYAELDLLIASQYLIYNIGLLLNIDVSKPSYSEEAMKIYFYKGKLD